MEVCLLYLDHLVSNSISFSSVSYHTKNLVSLVARQNFAEQFLEKLKSNFSKVYNDIEKNNI